MHIGPQRSRREQRTTIEPGDLVATYLDKYANEWPQIGEVTELLNANQVELQWFTGTVTSKWKKMTIGVRGQRGARQDWRETVDRSSIILPPFKLTAGGKLPLSTVTALKDIYSNYF